MSTIDKAVAVREGESIRKDQLETFLKDTIPGMEGDLEIKQFPSGWSNLTYLLKCGARELVLRRPPHGTKAATAHDMAREYRVLKALRPVFPYCPEALVYTEDLSILGCPFFVMERINGIILRKDLPEGMTLSPSDARCLCENLVKIMYELHSIDYKGIGLADFGKPQGYVRRQVEGWSDRYRKARTEDAPDYEAIMQWLLEKMPDDSDTPGIIHNDYKFDNVVLNPENPHEIIGILDWELSTVGDPLMDLGSTISYWVDQNDSEEMKLMRLMPTTQDGMFTRDELVRYYLDLSGRSLDNYDFYFCFGLFRLAVIAQQIYYRYFHGQTKDERFALIISGVILIENVAKQLIDSSRL